MFHGSRRIDLSDDVSQTGLRIKFTVETIIRSFFCLPPTVELKEWMQLFGMDHDYVLLPKFETLKSAELRFFILKDLYGS